MGGNALADRIVTRGEATRRWHREGDGTIAMRCAAPEARPLRPLRCAALRCAAPPPAHASHVPFRCATLRCAALRCAALPCHAMSVCVTAWQPLQPLASSMSTARVAEMPTTMTAAGSSSSASAGAYEPPPPRASYARPVWGWTRFREFARYRLDLGLQHPLSSIVLFLLSIAVNVILGGLLLRALHAAEETPLGEDQMPDDNSSWNWGMAFFNAAHVTADPGGPILTRRTLARALARARPIAQNRVACGSSFRTGSASQIPAALWLCAFRRTCACPSRTVRQDPRVARRRVLHRLSCHARRGQTKGRSNTVAAPGWTPAIQ